MSQRRESINDRSAKRVTFVATGQISLLLTFLLFAVVALLISHSSIDFRVAEWPGTILLFMAFLPVALVYTYMRFDIHVASLCDIVSVLCAFVAASAVFTYAATHMGSERPLVDEWLLAADVALGFDWMAMLAWLNERPMIAEMRDAAYFSMLNQVVCVIALLVIFSQQRRLQIFIIAVQVSLIVTGLVPALFPAIGIYPFLELSPELHHPAISLGTMDLHVADFLQLRGPEPSTAYGDMQGIVVIPSFHMAAAVLFMWAFWAVPVVRWLALALNLATAASTPLSGGHYIVDLFAGAMLAVLAIALATAIRGHVERRAVRNGERLPSVAEEALAFQRS